MRVAFLGLALTGCYLSHAPPAEEADVTDVTPPVADQDPCIIVSTPCMAARAVRQSETCPWSPAACEEPAGEWCCLTGPASRRAVDVDGECRLDTDACLSYEEVAPVRSATDLARDLPEGGTLVTVVGTVGVLYGDTDSGPVPAMALDGALRLVGAPCGVDFDCEDDTHCAPVPGGRRIRVTGWVNAFLMICARPPWDEPTIDVVSWTDAVD